MTSTHSLINIKSTKWPRVRSAYSSHRSSVGSHILGSVGSVIANRCPPSKVRRYPGYRQQA